MLRQNKSDPLRLLLAAIALLSGISAAFSSDLKMLPGHVPAAISTLTPRGRLTATNELQLAIGLPLRNGPDLAAFLRQLYEPANPLFRQFLTPAEFTARFGPTEKDYEVVQEFARRNGLTVTRTYTNRLVLDVSGPVAAVEKAFHITLHTYRHPTEARDFFAPDTEPMVEAALPVLDIEGLSDYAKPHPRLHPPEVHPSKNGSAPDGSGSYFGGDFRNAYVPGTSLTGAGQSVGLLEFDGFYFNDITAYAVAAGGGRTNIIIQTVLLDNYDGVPTTTGNGNAEVSLDIEMAMAMAPGLSNIVVFEAGPAGNQNDLLNAMLEAGKTVKNLSCSWGWGGGPNASTDQIFTNMAAVGQSFFNASGDSDAFTTGSNSVNGVDNPSTDNAPSSSPMITQVGGTTLTMNGDGVSYVSETVWNRGNGVGSSGGISSYYSIPDWQTNLDNLTGAGGSAIFRNIPDVAMTAEDVYVVSGGSGQGSGGFGGTSCAAPLWAGFLALVNQQAATRGLQPVGFINPALYTIAAGPDYADYFHDITTGSNTWTGSPNLFYATNGYDLCTGLGTPNGTSLINALAGNGYLEVSPSAGAAAGVAGGPFSIGSGNFVLTNTGSFDFTWSLVNTSAWVTFSATNGILAAGTQTNLTASLTPAAGNLPVGTYTSGLIFTNWTFPAALTVPFTLQISQPLIISPTNGFAVSGVAGVIVGPGPQNYTLTNLSAGSVPWNLINTSSWLQASPTGGALPGNAQTNLTISLMAAADNLPTGIYSVNLLVTNPAGLAASLPFTLNIRAALVDNGGFETGNFAGWILDGSAVFNIVTSSSVFVHSGDYGAALAQFGSLGFLSQSLATQPGQNYLLSLWLENPTNPAGATPNQFLVQWNGSSLFNQTNLPFTPWTNLQFIVTGALTNSILQLGFENTPYYLGLDDISLTPLSAPEFTTPQTRVAGAFDLTWSAAPNLIYQLQYQTNLLQTNWINIGTPLLAASNTLNFVDTNASSAPVRFYRVVEQP